MDAPATGLPSELQARLARPDEVQVDDVVVMPSEGVGAPQQVAPDDPRQAIRALIAVSEHHRLVGDSVQADRAAHQAYEAAASIDDDPLASEALVSKAIASWLRLDLTGATDALSEAVERGRRSPPSAALPSALGRAALTALWAGDLSSAQAASGEALEWARRAGLPASGVMSLAAETGIAAVKGDLASARALGHDALHLQRVAGETWASAFLYPILASAALARGEWDEAAGELAAWSTELDETGGVPQQPVVAAMRLCVRARRGVVGPEERSALAGRRDHRHAAPPAVRDEDLIVGCGSYALAAIETADALQVPVLAEAMLPMAQACYERGKIIGASWSALFPRAIATAARIAGDTVVAQAMAGEAIAVAERLDLGPELGRAHLESAVIHAHKRSQLVDARDHLAAALAVFQQFGMAPFEAEAIRLGRRLGKFD